VLGVEQDAGVVGMATGLGRSGSAEVADGPLTEVALAGSVAELVRIPSVEPFVHGPRAAEAGVAGEAALARHLADRYTDLGAAEVVLDEASPERPNVYALFPGHTERLVVIDAHLDTVGVEDMTDPPFDGRVEDGYVWGRGALDSKATTGVMLSLLSAWQLAGTRPDPTLLVVGTVGEELAGFPGAIRFRHWAVERGLDIDQLVVAEPTDLVPVHGHKGGVGLLITTVGRAAHSAVPERGINAIDAMAPVLVALQEEHDRLQAKPPSTAVGCATVSVTTITGGTGPSVVPERCSIIVSRRTVPGEDPDEVYDGLAELARTSTSVPVEVDPLIVCALDGKIGYTAFHQPPDTALVRRLASHTGNAPATAPYGSNALVYSGLARELVVFGPGSIDDAHAPTERIALDDLVRTSQALEGWLDPR
jgi:acetylornithine deacetylase/succinyl-diaminopimelate desuccinylase-like protein